MFGCLFQVGLSVVIHINLYKNTKLIDYLIVVGIWSSNVAVALQSIHWEKNIISFVAFISMILERAEESLDAWSETVNVLATMHPGRFTSSHQNVMPNNDHNQTAGIIQVELSFNSGKDC